MLSERDLYLIKTHINIFCCQGNGNAYSFYPQNSETGRKWKIEINSEKINSKNIEIVRAELMTGIFMIIKEISLLSSQKIKTQIEEIGEEFIKYFYLFSNPLEEVETKLICPSQSFPTISSDIFANFVINYHIHPSFKWKSTICPSYPKNSVELLEKRYQNVIKPIRKSLKKYIRNLEFLSKIKSLQTEGWKDWQILSAISLVILNKRLNKLGYFLKSPSDFKKYNEKLLNLMNIEETSEDFFFSTKEVIKNIDDSLVLVMISSLKAYGMSVNHNPIETKGIKDFMKFRLKYFDDDIPHENYFDI